MNLSFQWSNDFLTTILTQTSSEQEVATVNFIAVSLLIKYQDIFQKRAACDHYWATQQVMTSWRICYDRLSMMLQSTVTLVGQRLRQCLCRKHTIPQHCVHNTTIGFRELAVVDRTKL